MESLASIFLRPSLRSALDSLGVKRRTRRKRLGPWKYRIGRTRQKLWLLLCEAGFNIPDPSCFWQQEGGYRSMHWDLARWGVGWEEEWPEGNHGSSPRTRSLYSWDTMTECARYGITVGDDGEEIHANPKPTKEDVGGKKKG